MGGIPQSNPKRGFQNNQVKSAYKFYGADGSSEGDKDSQGRPINLKYSGISRFDLNNMSVEDIYKKMDKNI